MPTQINETVLQGILNGSQRSQITTSATFWTLPGSSAESYPTIFVPGNSQINIGGQTRTYKDGAFVFVKNGQIDTLPASEVRSGGVTIGSSPVRPVTINPSTGYPEGNIATLRLYEGSAPGTSSLSLSMPEGQGAGFGFRYPAPTAAELVNLAKQENAMVQLKGADGKVLEGFFAKNSGGVMPENIGPYTSGRSYEPGDFVSIHESPGGRVSVFPYQNYTAEEMRQATRNGQRVEPGNDQAKLTTLDGKPVDAKNFVQLDTRAALPNAPENVAPQGQPADGQGTPVDATSKTAEGQGGPTNTSNHTAEGGPDVPPAAQPAVDGPAGKPPVDAPPVGSNVSVLGRLAKGILPAALAALPVFEGISDGYQSYKNGEGSLGVAEGTAAGLGKGTVDTFLPGARNGYSDVTGGDRTMVDRFLNAASDATGTATAVGAAAMAVEGAGVVTIPSMIPTGAATLVAGVSNLGINAAKGALKVTGLAGADQDGGYIYDGAKAAVGEVSHLLGFDNPYSSTLTRGPGTEGNTRAAANAGLDSEHLLRQSTALANEVHRPSIDHFESRP